MIENIEVFTQSSIRIRNQDKTIYLDPFGMRDEPGDADYVLITHNHYDHFSPEDIKKVSKSDTTLIIPEKMAGKGRKAAGVAGKVCTVNPGSSYNIDGLAFDTVPAYNNLKPFHPKSAGWVGYIVKVDGKRIYVAGDTDMTKDNRNVRCDIALVPIGGTYTMDAGKAAELVNSIRPEVAIPTHYGSIVGSFEDEKIFAENVKEPIEVVVKMLYRD